MPKYSYNISPAVSGITTLTYPLRLFILSLSHPLIGTTLHMFYDKLFLKVLERSVVKYQ